MKAQHPHVDPLLPGRRFLRDVPRGRDARRKDPRHHADLPRRRCPAGGGSGQGRRRIPAPAGRRRDIASPSASRWRIPGWPRAWCAARSSRRVTPGALLAGGVDTRSAQQLDGRPGAAGQRGGLGGSPPWTSARASFSSRSVPADGLEEALSRLNPAEVVVADDDQAPLPRRAWGHAAPHPARAPGSSIPRSRATISPGGSTSPRSMDWASVPTIRRPSAPRARCSATWASSSPADCRTWLGPRPPERPPSLARRDDPAKPGAGRAAPRRRPRLHPARDARLHPHADGRPAAAAAGCSRRSRSPPISSVGSTRSRSTVRDAPRPGPAARGARRRAGSRAARRAGPRRPRHAPGARRAPRLVPAASRRRRSAGRPGRLVASRRATQPRPGRGRRASSICSPTWPPSSARRWTTACRPRWPTAASFARATTPELDELRVAARRRTPVHRLAAAAGAGAHRHRARSRSASTRSSATTSRSPTPTRPGSRPITSAGRRWPRPSGTSPPSSRSTRPRSSAPKSGSPPARPSCSARSAAAVGGGDRPDPAHRPGAGPARRVGRAGRRRRSQHRYVRPDGASTGSTSCSRAVPASGDRAA